MTRSAAGFDEASVSEGFDEPDDPLDDGVAASPAVVAGLALEADGSSDVGVGATSAGEGGGVTPDGVGDAPAAGDGATAGGTSLAGAWLDGA